MQKGYEAGVAKTSRFVQVTPKMLRTIADRLEALSRSVEVKESVTFELTTDITLYYDPGIEVQAPRDPMVKPPPVK